MLISNEKSNSFLLILDLNVEDHSSCTTTTNCEEEINYFDQYSKITSENDENSLEIIPLLQNLLSKIKEDKNRDSILFDLKVEVQNKIETLKCIKENELEVQKHLNLENNKISNENNYKDSKREEEEFQKTLETSTFATYNRFDEGI